MVPIFEVVERPNDWDRQVQDIAREARAPTDLGAFRKDFWSHLIARHSSESKLGGANGASSRWRPIAELIWWFPNIFQNEVSGYSSAAFVALIHLSGPTKFFPKKTS